MKSCWRQKIEPQSTIASHDDENEKGELVSRLQIEMRRRRDKARMTVELSYVLAMPDICNQLPRDLFEGWVGRYLGDHLSPEEVEENSNQLQALLGQHLKSSPQESQTFPSLEELNHWLRDEQARIRSLAITDEEKQRKLLELQENYISLAHRAMSDSAPSVVALPKRRTLPLKETKSM